MASSEPNDGVGKGTLALTDSVKRELYNEEQPSTSCASAQKKKRKKNNDATDEEWVNVGRLGFYLEIPRPRNQESLVEQLKLHSGKMLSVTPHDDSYNPSAILVGIPGHPHTTVWKYGGDIYLTRLLTYSRRTKCIACLPDSIEVLDDPKRKTWALVPIDIHFRLHREIDVLDGDKNVKRQVKALINYMRGGTQPNPARHTWPVVREEIAEECVKNANVLERLMKKKTAKDWWKE